MKKILSIALIALFAIQLPLSVLANDPDPDHYKPYQPTDKNESVKDTVRVAFGVGFLTLAMFTGHKWWDSVHQGTAAITVDHAKTAESVWKYFSWGYWTDDKASIAPQPNMKIGAKNYLAACGWGAATVGSSIAGLTLILQGLHIVRK